eukprot:11181130-Lingulodinium_polyedra.AAC.1
MYTRYPEPFAPVDQSSHWGEGQEGKALHAKAKAIDGRRRAYVGHACAGARGAVFPSATVQSATATGGM